MEKKNIKIVFIDIDGTLADDNKNISVEDIESIKKIRAKGVHVCLTSGKPAKSIQRFSELCGAWPYAISSTGAFVCDMDTNKVIYCNDIKKDTAISILNIVKKFKLYEMVTISGDLIVDERKFGMYKPNRPESIEVNSILEYIQNTQGVILQFTIIDESIAKLQNLKNELSDLRVSTNLDKIEIPEHFLEKHERGRQLFALDVTAKNVSKYFAVKALLEYLNINVENSMAIGDGLNDLEMFKAVGYKVAMANAVKQIKDLADFETLSNNDSGVAFAINRIIAGD